MFNIDKYLQKFSKNINSAELYKKQILDIIEVNTKIKLLPETVEIKDCVVLVTSSPAVKNKLFIYKSKILEEIERTIPVKVVDIK